MSTQPFLSLNDDDLVALGIGSVEIANCIEQALIKATTGAIWTAPKVALQPGDGRYMMATLAASDGPDLMVVKAVLLNPENPGRGFDTINGAIMVFDSATGFLRCVMGANWITGVRTAGLSAVAARRLANPDASVIAFVGCGVQARSHLQAFSDIFPLTEMRALGRGAKNIARLTELGASLDLSSQVCKKCG